MYNATKLKETGDFGENHKDACLIKKYNVECVCLRLRVSVCVQQHVVVCEFHKFNWRDFKSQFQCLCLCVFVTLLAQRLTL